MRIAVDIDDTLNIVDRFERTKAYIERKGLPFQVKNPRSNKLVEMFDWKIDDVIRYVREDGGMVLYTDALARKGAKEALAGWRSFGHEVIILTSRQKSWYGNPERVSRDWLEKRRIPYDEIVAEIPLSEKGSYCYEHRISVLVDDDISSCLDAQRRGIKAVLAVGRHNLADASKVRYAGGTWNQIDKIVRGFFP